jgi:4'-phosphopantetheinyl transferase
MQLTLNSATAGNLWRPAPPNPVLADGEAHVWAASLKSHAPALQRHSETLSSDERARAAKFIFDIHRHRYITGRSMLRRVLGRYLDVDSRRLEFVVSPLGKPGLALAFAGAGIHFNVSHSEDLALIAVTRIGPVGVDVECIRPVRDMDHLVERFFSSRENGLFQALRDEDKPAAFFNLWTRKEALLKATGAGITRLSTVEVSFLAGERPRVLAFDGDPEKAREWQLEECAPEPGYAGAVAIQAPAMRVCRWAASERGGGHPCLP